MERLGSFWRASAWNDRLDGDRDPAQGLRLMKFEELYGRTLRGELSQAEAAEILGMSERTFRRWRDRFQADGAEGLYVFRGRRGYLLKILWHDGIGISLYAKRLERRRFSWPSTAGGAVSISAAQLGYLLEGIEWRNPVRTWRPSRAG